MNYAGIAALIAVSAVAGSVLIAVSGIIYYHQPLQESGQDVLNIAIGGLLTLAGTYIGSRL